jgi:uncharacterized protein (TIGR03790 family)
MRLHLAVVFSLFVALVPRPAHAQSAENILVVANSASPASLEIVDYYASKRSIPADQILRLSLPVAEQIPRATYETLIERPIADWLTSHVAQDRILYIVLTKGVPLRVEGTNGINGLGASVDSELTLLYRKMSGILVLLNGSIKNPYFADDTPLTAAKPFTHRDQDIYLVTRLDGFTVADVKGLIDRSVTASKEGVIVLHGTRELVESQPNLWLDKAAAALSTMAGWKDRIVHDNTLAIPHDQQNVLGYYSWGSNDPRAALIRHPNLGFVPGAIGATFVNTDARTFQEPPAGWLPGGRQEFAGSRQSLTGDLIRSGLTGVAGQIAEPYVSATIRPDVLFPAYISGFNLAESFYLATPALSWQTVVVGDPLTAPFRRQALTSREIDPGLDPVSEFPQLMADRRVSLMSAAGTKPEAARLALKAEARAEKKDRRGAREALEQATAIDNGFVAGHMSLASLYEETGEWDAAVDRYRRVIARVPNQPQALNNLAFVLAVHKNAATEALPLAVRAFASVKNNPTIEDTLGWIHHLLGHDEQAEGLLVEAAKSAPTVADIQIHAAIVLAANGKRDAALRSLEQAASIDKSIESRPEVQSLRARLR